MSQIDKVNFFPNLIWFLFLIGIFYFLIFSYILPLIYQSMEVRFVFFSFLLKENFFLGIFYYFVLYLHNFNVFDTLINNSFLFLNTFLRVSNLFQLLSLNFLIKNS